MKDIRLITLYKQHYLDQYSKPLQSEYSCWGYYDGMDIGEMQDMRLGRVSENHSVTPISQLWYMIGKKVEETTGQYGSINIGIFRCCEGAEADKRLEEFWNEKKKFLSLKRLLLNGKTGIKQTRLRFKMEMRLYLFPFYRYLCLIIFSNNFL